MSALTMPVGILAMDETTVTTTLFQLLQWKHGLHLEERGITVGKGGRKVSAHLRKVLKTGRGYPRDQILTHIESSIDDIQDQLRAKS